MRPLPFVLLLAACGERHHDDGDTGMLDTGTETPSEYAFTRNGEDSVAYSGQTFRHVLIVDMKSHLGGLTDRLNSDFFPTSGDVEAELLFYLDFDSSVAGDLSLGVSADLPLEQSVYNDISSDKDLRGKLAGNDTVTDHVDWSTSFVGWAGATSPEALVLDWIDTIDAQAVAWNSAVPQDPSGNPVPAVYVTPEGQDMQQLLQKFLLGAIAFSQGTDDYLDDDVDGKGLLSDHSAPTDSAYTTLEHQWDEGFGYFGASVTYGDWTLDEIADGFADPDGSGSIDLGSEVCWGHSTNAAKRDRGAVVATDMVGEAWDGFLAGRTLLANTEGELTDDEMDELEGYRDQAVTAWEAAIASTVVHYINDTIQDMDAVGTSDYDFGDHAKHWSEMKGFALSLQFNPRSPLSDTDFATLHDKLGTAPALEGDADFAAYRTGLLEARALLGAAYGFDTDNLGDDDGLGGW